MAVNTVRHCYLRNNTSFHTEKQKLLEFEILNVHVPSFSWPQEVELLLGRKKKMALC